MTIQVELLVAGVSLVREIWHEPPPCTADPMKERGCSAPMLMSVTVAPVLLVALHGKSEPSAERGLLLGLPYGGGDPRIIWALLVAAKRVTAEKERMDMIEDILRLKIAVVLRSRRRAMYGDDLKALLLCLLSVVGVIMGCEERRIVRTRYIGDQRSNEQIQSERIKNAIQCVIVIESAANNKECEAI